jgi:hypothetical protein
MHDDRQRLQRDKHARVLLAITLYTVRTDKSLTHCTIDDVSFPFSLALNFVFLITGGF